MRVIHTADLHIGKVIYEFSMLKDQREILQQLVDIIEEEKADILLIAGDIYDRSIPPAEAVAVFDSFLSQVIELGVKVAIISGNHDSPERISFANHILHKQGVYIAGNITEDCNKFELEDKYGTISFYLLPFAKPQTVRYQLQIEEIYSYEQSVKETLKQFSIDPFKRNILVTHHFVTNQGLSPQLCDSESVISVGGVNNIDVSFFSQFDYVALGHIHGSQKVGRETIRYAGSPLKYSFSEVFHKKSVTVIELKEKGNITIMLRPLHAKRDLRKIKGMLANLLEKEVYEAGNPQDYLEVTLTNTEELINPMDQLKAVYPNIMRLEKEKASNWETEQTKNTLQSQKNKTVEQLYNQFYKQVAGKELDQKQKTIITKIIEEIEEVV